MITDRSTQQAGTLPPVKQSRGSLEPVFKHSLLGSRPSAQQTVPNELVLHVAAHRQPEQGHVAQHSCALLSVLDRRKMQLLKHQNKILKGKKYTDLVQSK